NVRAAHDLFERREEVLAQDALRDIRGTRIRAALGLTVTGHVLERSEHLVRRERQCRALETLHGGNAEPRNQVRILAEGFLATPPARSARDVDDRSEHPLPAARADL